MEIETCEDRMTIQDWAGPGEIATARITDYEKFMDMVVTVKHYDANDGQKRVIFRALHEVRHNLGGGDRLLIACVMGMTQESTCRSLHYGDASSVGPWQQQSWWGSLSDREDAAISTHNFVMGVAGCPGWHAYYPLSNISPSWNLGACVQRVQRSAYPDGSLYSQWQSEAEHTVSQFLKAAS